MLSPYFVFLAVLPLTFAQFKFPPAGYEFRTGETQTIRWQTLSSTFTIGLWQQAATGGSASLGPILIQTTKNGPTVTQFDWVVQAYGFDLGKSDKFFFWLFEGDASQQGNQSATSLSSPYFHIKEQSQSSSTPTSQQTIPVSTTPQASTFTPNTTLNADSGQANTDKQEQPKGLSGGSLAGIAVLTTLVGIAALVGVAYWIRRLRKNQKDLRAQLEQQTAKLNRQHIYEQSSLDKQATTASYTLEKPNDRYTGPVELG